MLIIKNRNPGNKQVFFKTAIGHCSEKTLAVSRERM